MYVLWKIFEEYCSPLNLKGTWKVLHCNNINLNSRSSISQFEQLPPGKKFKIKVVVNIHLWLNISTCKKIIKDKIILSLSVVSKNK